MNRNVLSLKTILNEDIKTKLFCDMLDNYENVLYVINNLYLKLVFIDNSKES